MREDRPGHLVEWRDGMETINCIEIQNLKLPYREQEINLKFVKGINYLKGNNGSGKTMLLDCIAGLFKKDADNIKGNESIVYINQNIFFSDRLTGMDFLKFVYGLDNNREGRKIFEKKYCVIEEINQTIRKQWGMLSGGERKFLYAIILLSLDREWYILDEPFAFVDAVRRGRLWEIINEKVAEGKGIILTSHQEDSEIEKYSTQIVTI